MSAIWGCINLKKEPLPETCSASMKIPFKDCKIDKFSEMSGEGFYMGAGIQYFVPEAEKEEFPIKVDSAYITADCLVDNREELCVQLGITDDNACDGRILTEAYKQWGRNCLCHLRGQFAFVVYERENGCVFLAADQAANRCLYYCLEEECLYFSTLMEPIKRMKKSLRWNRAYICETLAMPGLRLQMGMEETPYEGIYKIPAGYFCIVSTGGIKKVAYWNPIDFHKKRLFSSTEECGTIGREIAVQSVADALRTDGNVGIALSSGLDSSTVGGIAAEILKRNGKSIYSYTYTPLSDYQEKDKFAIADETDGVKLFGRMHDNLIMRFMDNADCDSVNHMKKMISILEMPYKAVQNMPLLFRLYEQAYQDGCRVLLNGHYGNVTLSYGNHVNAIYDSLLHGRIKEAYRQFVDFCNVNKIRKKSYGISLMLRYAREPFRCLAEKVSRRDVKESYVNPRFAGKYRIQSKISKMGFGAQTSQFVSLRKYRRMFYDRGDLTYLGEIATKMSLATGVLIRDPFQSVDILEFCADVPMEMFVHGGVERWLIRENMQEYVPDAILHNYGFRGKQSADWLFRLQKEADKNITVMKTECFHPVISPFLNTKKLEGYFRKLDRHFREELFEQTNKVLYVTGLSIFLQSNPER